MKCKFCDNELSSNEYEYVESTFCPNMDCVVNVDGIIYDIVVRPPKSATKIVITSTPSGKSIAYSEYKKSMNGGKFE